MKITAYEVRNDERKYFEEVAVKYNIEIVYTKETLNDDTVELARGCLGVTILGQSKINPSILDKLKKLNICYISTRTVGYNHIDINYASQIGIKTSNASYEPNGVADFTIMLILMSIRHYKQALFRGNVNDYSLEGLQGREMKNLTVGVLGSGRIGSKVIDHLRGFGCRILVYDTVQNQNVAHKAKYVDLDTLYSESDIITLHIALKKDTYYMINKEALSKMKDGVVLINCARGELMDIESVIEGIETKKIGALGLDVFENEEEIYHRDRRTDILTNREMAYIRQFPNVTMTQHIAFYTDSAVKSMVTCGVSNLVSFIQKGECENEIMMVNESEL